jgi:hydroxymethylpyrimidine/phosphomethylpyrimidine kinase
MQTGIVSGATDTIPVCLTIAGSDSSGGAGLQMDLAVFQALGCAGASVVT